MKILMVCLGNICRSPLAEGVLKQKLNNSNLNVVVDSAGTAPYHIGEHPDNRTIKNALEHDVDISQLVGRQFSVDDYDVFDLIYTMDESNFKNVVKLARTENDSQKVKMFLNESYPGKNMAVPDPYFGGPEGFEKVFQLIDHNCEIIINNLKNG